jgi:hypothetical protein
MERLRSLTRRAGVVLPALFAAQFAAGCATTPPAELVPDAFLQAVALEKPTPDPATQIVCIWQRQLRYLPDPTRDGTQIPGIVGQLFLITPTDSPAEVNGDLAVVVTDETPRPPGQPAKTSEYWHYTKDTLKRLASVDEKWGKCYVLFLPWPAHWHDVTDVKVMARYQPAVKEHPELHAGEVRMALDFSTGGTAWADMGSRRELYGVPDPARMLQQARTGGMPPQVPTAPPGVPAQPVAGAGYNVHTAAPPQTGWSHQPPHQPAPAWPAPHQYQPAPAWPAAPQQTGGYAPPPAMPLPPPSLPPTAPAAAAPPAVLPAATAPAPPPPTIAPPPPAVPVSGSLAQPLVIPRSGH